MWLWRMFLIAQHYSCHPILRDLYCPLFVCTHLEQSRHLKCHLFLDHKSFCPFRIQWPRPALIKRFFVSPVLDTFRIPCNTCWTRGSWKILESILPQSKVSWNRKRDKIPWMQKCLETGTTSRHFLYSRDFDVSPLHSRRSTKAQPTEGQPGSSVSKSPQTNTMLFIQACRRRKGLRINTIHVQPARRSWI